MRENPRARKIQSTVAWILRELKPWGPVVWAQATTGSTYIKFPHWKLGSIRISDHPGIEKYSYKWIISIDRRYRPKNYFWWRDLAVFKVRFEALAVMNGLKPGDAQLWEEYTKQASTEFKKFMYERRGLCSTK
jgi:hypothetical protein